MQQTVTAIKHSNQKTRVQKQTIKTNIKQTILKPTIQPKQHNKTKVTIIANPHNKIKTKPNQHYYHTINQQASLKQ